MSGGASALKGLNYQQCYAIYRILCTFLESDVTNTQNIQNFAIEGNIENSSIWDVVFQYADNTTELWECKDTKIEKSDRITFYKRIREERAKSTNEISQCGFATDGSKNNAHALEVLRNLAKPIKEPMVTPESPPKRITSDKTALNEALYFLCVDTKQEYPPLDISQAQETLSNIEIVEYTHEWLQDSIESILENIFTNSIGEHILDVIIGFISQETVRNGQCCFSLEDFKGKLSERQLVFELKPDVLSIIREDSGIADQPLRQSSIVWTQLEDKPETTLGIESRLPDLVNVQKCWVQANQGVGKTVLSHLEFERSKLSFHPINVIWIDAKSFTQEKLKCLTTAMKLLCGLRKTMLIIDGFDEVQRIVKSDWYKVFSYLIRIPNLWFRVFIRSEVVYSEAEFKRALSDIDTLSIDELNNDEIVTIFNKVKVPVPKDSKLLSLLRNPFILSLYAHSATKFQLSNASGSPSTAFEVVSSYLESVLSDTSIGLRQEGNEQFVRFSKRKAYAHLESETLSGNIQFLRSNTDEQLELGIDILVKEGVLIETSHQQTEWRHEWFREVVLVKSILTDKKCHLPHQYIEILFNTISPEAHRPAVVGLTKWMLSQELKPPHSIAKFLSILRNKDSALSREALIVCLRAEDNRLELNQLPTDYLAEAITFSVQLEICNWATQIPQIDDGHFRHKFANELMSALLKLSSSNSGSGSYGDYISRCVSGFNIAQEDKQVIWASVARDILSCIENSEIIAHPEIRHELNKFYTDPYTARPIITIVLRAHMLGFSDDAIKIIRFHLHLDNPQAWVQYYSHRDKDYFLEELFSSYAFRKLVILYPDTWGEVLIQLFAILCEKEVIKKEEDNASLRKAIYNDILGASLPDDEEQKGWRRSSKDSTFRHYRSFNFGHKANLGICAKCIEKCLVLALRLDKPNFFRGLSSQLYSLEFSFGIAIVLQTLFDILGKNAHRREWHVQEAERLLSLEETNTNVCSRYWRCLIRKRLEGIGANVDWEKIASILRSSYIQHPSRLSELSQISHLITLSDCEVEELKVANKNKVIWPLAKDPRDDDNGKIATVYKDEYNIEDKFGARWPIQEDEALIKLLDDNSNDLCNVNSTEVNDERIWECRNALHKLSKEPAFYQEPFLPYCMEWYKCLLRRIKTWLGVYEKHILESGHQEMALKYYMPLWEKQAQTALDVLKSYPEEHALNDELASNGWYGSDAYGSAFQLMDEVLATENVLNIKEIRKEFGTLIQSLWDSWSDYTQSMFLCIFRDYNIAQSQELKSVIKRVVREPNNLLLVKFSFCRFQAFTLLERIYYTRVALGRVDSSDEGLQLLRTTIKWTLPIKLHPFDLQKDQEEIKEAKNLWADIRSLEGDIKFFASSYILDLLNQSISDERELHNQLAENFCDLITGSIVGLDECLLETEQDPFEDATECINEIISRDWDMGNRHIFGEQLGTYLPKILEMSQIAGCHDFHMYFPVWLGTDENFHTRKNSLGAKVLIYLSDEVLLDIANIAVTKIVQWKKSEYRSNDLAYGRVLEGHMTVEILKSIYNEVVDRESAYSIIYDLGNDLISAGFLEQGTKVLYFLET